MLNALPPEETAASPSRAGVSALSHPWGPCCHISDDNVTASVPTPQGHLVPGQEFQPRLARVLRVPGWTWPWLTCAVTSEGLLVRTPQTLLIFEIQGSTVGSPPPVPAPHTTTTTLLTPERARAGLGGQGMWVGAGRGVLGAGGRKRLDLQMEVC